jgi:hypothetical protein
MEFRAAINLSFKKIYIFVKFQVCLKFRAPSSTMQNILVVNVTKKLFVYVRILSFTLCNQGLLSSKSQE